MAALALALMAGKSSAQGIAAPAPQLPYGLEQVLKLEQAKVGDNVIIAYIYNSGDRYTLDAGQLIYLKQQGVSDAVLTTMLTQPKAADASTPMAFSSQPSDANVVAVPATPAPAQVTYVPADSADYGSSYGYPYYYGGWCWPFNVSWGWTWFGSGWHWNGGWHGSAGWGGGWHGGSAWSGGGWHGGGTWSGGWHGSGSWGGSHGGGGWHSSGSSWHGGSSGGWHSSGGGSGWHGGGGGSSGHSGGSGHH